jgi:diguanylate cyclase (GGDEF)-like protein
MRRLLAPVAAQVIEVASGAEALQACLDHDFALILLDVQMPGMDGFEVAQVLSEDPLSRETPIIFVTAAYADDMNRLKGYSFGAVDYIAKPINDQVLLSKVKVFLDLWRSKQQLQALLNTLADRNKKLEEEIAERRRIETLVRHQAQHDALTGLPNRILFLDRLDTAVDRATRHRENFALLYIDIDGFKPVNDNHGHAVGDVLLREIGQRLLRGTRKTDTVARLGGDEFAVILEEVANERAALQVGLKLCEALEQPFLLSMPDGDLTVRVGASVGVAVFPEHGKDRDTLINAADAAMYRAKRAGKNHAVLASPLGHY